MSDFINRLSALCKKHPLKEKWLLSPNRRAGFQIIDRISLQGQGIINMCVKTISSIVMDITAGFMTSNNLARIRPLRQELLMGELFHRLKEKGGGYLSRLKSSSGLFKSLVSSLSELRNAGVSRHRLHDGLFEEPAKGKEILFLLSLYEKELAANNYLDYAGALMQAIRIVKSGNSILHPDLLILALPDMITHDFTPLEQQFWHSIPDNQKVEIKQENPAAVHTDPETDLSLLRMITHHFDVPDPVKDGSVDFFKAYGAANEVREVFRRIVHGDISFDQVEIIHTDAGTYVPLIYETAYKFPLDKDAMVSVSFAEGIPVKYSRPGRALIAWISWIENGYPQTVLRRMIQDGLLHFEIEGTGDVNFSEFALLFRQIQIGKGKNRYKTVFENHLKGLNNKLKYLQRTEEESDEEYEKRKKRLETKCRRYNELKQVVFRLLDNTPPPDAVQKEIIEKAVWFMKTMTRCISKLDNYASDIIHKRMEELVGYMNGNIPLLHRQLTHFDVWNWLHGLADRTKVSGLGPREGCVYVTDIESGGYSGRPYTFIIGLDDSRFPGTGQYDPVLLDQERSDISKNLPLMADIPAKKIISIQRLFTRLKGRLTMSYAWMDIREDREMFPSQVLLSAYRIVSGKNETDQDDLANALKPPASFASSPPEHANTIDEWWLGKLCGEQKISNSREAVGTSYHHLARGFTAKEMRDSKDFSVFDGYVPDAGRDVNPYNKDGLVLSVNMFELLAKSPLDFFFKYILCIEPLEDEEVDVNVWLDPLSRGSLLHSVFQEFLITLRDKGERPSMNTHREMIRTILNDHVLKQRDINPPFHEYAYERDLYLLQKATDIFLNREEEFCISSIPEYFEVNIGIPYEVRATELDSKTPICLELPADKTIRVRARIDRIDKTAKTNPPVYSVWDYKTGRSRRYDRNDPFKKGRIVQNILYLLIAEKQLTGKVTNTASVSHFGYFFTSLSEMGQRISWPASLLKTGKEYLITLADMIRDGCFLSSFEENDLKYTDYEDVLIDKDLAMEQAMKKFKNQENTALESMRRLRTGLFT